MRNLFLCIAIAAMLMLNLCSCEKETFKFETNNISVSIKEGENWIHDFPLFLGIDLKNPPQFAVWIEDTSGNYISTLFVTKRIAKEGWRSNGGNRRKEALPHWCHQRGVIYDDGLYLPTKEKPLTDGISGATPKSGIQLKLQPTDDLRQFVIKAEFNHSIDFNDSFPESAKEGDGNYSGGNMGSGQPALVYAATIDLDNEIKEYQLQLIGHSSPDGSQGNIYSDLSGITSADKIVKEIIIKIK
jgi:hypothetical protein